MNDAPTPDELALVLGHIRARSISHPESPATGHYTMSDHRWRQCVAALRAAGHRITDSISVGGDRACNETGYTLAAQPTDNSEQAAQAVDRARHAVDRATALALADAAEQRRQQLARWHADDRAAEQAAEQAAERGAGLSLEDR